MTATWSDQEFIERVERRSQEIGKPLAKVMRDARSSLDYLRHPAQTGRRIDKIIAIANALNWTLADALGLSPAPPKMVIDNARLRRSIEAAVRVTGTGAPDSAEVIADHATRIYRILSDREIQGRSVTDDELSLIPRIPRWRSRNNSGTPRNIS